MLKNIEVSPLHTSPALLGGISSTLSQTLNKGAGRGGGRGSSVGGARDSWSEGPRFDPRCGRPLPTGWFGVSIM